MPDLEATGADVQEQLQSPADPAAATSDGEPGAVPDVQVGLETPDADAAEQAAAVATAQYVVERDVPLEATEADAAEQSHVVDLDEDDYR